MTSAAISVYYYSFYLRNKQIQWVVSNDVGVYTKLSLNLPQAVALFAVTPSLEFVTIFSREQYRLSLVVEH